MVQWILSPNASCKFNSWTNCVYDDACDTKGKTFGDSIHCTIGPHLERGAKEHAVRPAVDVLFRSAATTYGPRIVGIILTGAGIDGTAGLLAIKQYGGITIVQHPDEARFPSMPHNAREQMQVDYLSPVANIASLLVSLVQPGR